MTDTPKQGGRLPLVRPARHDEESSRHLAHQVQSDQAASYALWVPSAPRLANCSSIQSSRASVVGGPSCAGARVRRPTPALEVYGGLHPLSDPESEAEAVASLS